MTTQNDTDALGSGSEKEVSTVKPDGDTPLSPLTPEGDLLELPP